MTLHQTFLQTNIQALQDKLYTEAMYTVLKSIVGKSEREHWRQTVFNDALRAHVIPAALHMYSRRGNQSLLG